MLGPSLHIKQKIRAPFSGKACHFCNLKVVELRYKIKEQHIDKNWTPLYFHPY